MHVATVLRSLHGLDKSPAARAEAESLLASAAARGAREQGPERIQARLEADEFDAVFDELTATA